MLDDYKTIFANNIFELDPTLFREHSINTGNAQPVKQLPRRLPNTLRAVVGQQVKEMTDSNIVGPSQSPWASLIVLVCKKDSTWRFCIDYRTLNNVTVRDSYMIPHVSDPLDTLAGQTYFTTLDLASGYWQVNGMEEHKEKTAFVIPGGEQLEFNRMPFGLANAVPM